MSRPPRCERLVAKGRPKRRAAAKAHFLKYQLASNPTKAEKDDLKRALQESLEEQNSSTTKKSSIRTISSTNSSDVSFSNNSSSSGNGSLASITSVTKRNRSINMTATNISPPNKRARVVTTTQTTLNRLKNDDCDGNLSVSSLVSPIAPQSLVQTRPLRTYSKTQPNDVDPKYQPKQQQQITDSLRSSTPIKELTTSINSPMSPISYSTKQPARIKNQTTMSKSTQTPNIKSNKLGNDFKTKKINIEAGLKKSKEAVNDSEASTQNCETLHRPVQEKYLKFKRESKNYAYAKMTALKVNTSKSFSGNSKSSSSKKVTSTNGILNNSSSNRDSSSKSKNNFDNESTPKVIVRNGLSTDNKVTVNALESELRLANNLSQTKKASQMNKSLLGGNRSKASKSSNNLHSVQLNNRDVIQIQDTIDIHLNNGDQKYDCPLDDTQDLSSNHIIITDNNNRKSSIQCNMNILKRRTPQGSWSLLGAPEEKVIYLRDDEPPKRLICYPAIKHVEGDVIQVRDSVLLRSGAKKTDPPYIAKVCAFWEDAETGGVMMSLFWYYKPEHTEEGRKPHHLTDEVFASRHRDVDSVECIEDKCYVLTFNEYCRYKKRCKMEQVNASWSLTDVTIPVSNESYPRRNRIPDNDVNPELVFCCRQIYDSRMKRLVKNPLINPKYGHI